MISRREVLQHPLAGDFDLPLIVPSFSSKGFGYLRKGKNKNSGFYSVLTTDLKSFSTTQKSSVLVSAYDLYHNLLLEKGERFNKIISHLSKSNLVFIDSGGYELISDFKLEDINAPGYQPIGDYGKNEYTNVLDEIVKYNKLHLVITNFDHNTRGKPLETQAKEALSLFSRYPDCLTNFIIKPVLNDKEFVDPGDITPNDFKNLRRFDIIGITEKELGENILDRIKRIVQFRKKLDDADILKPIHIWGGLDPILTSLYFFAGAEIFDGLSWLKYAFINGIASSRECYPILKSGYSIADDKRLNQLRINSDNLQAMRRHEINLKQWVDMGGDNFEMFEDNIKEQLQTAHDTMKTKIKIFKET